MKPACINMTRKPAINVQTMLIENRLWTIRSESAAGVMADGSPSPTIASVPSAFLTAVAAGVAQTPLLAPVASGNLVASSGVSAMYAGSGGAAVGGDCSAPSSCAINGDDVVECATSPA